MISNITLLNKDVIKNGTAIQGDQMSKNIIRQNAELIKKCTKSQPCDIGDGICTLDTECQVGLKCGRRNCPITIENEIEVIANCCFKPNGRFSSFKLLLVYIMKL